MKTVTKHVMSSWPVLTDPYMSECIVGTIPSNHLKVLTSCIRALTVTYIAAYMY